MSAPRLELGIYPTPLHPAPALGAVVGQADLWLKRDDLCGFTWGGNKVRAAEYVVAEALAGDVDLLVLAGGPTSNCVAIFAAAAATVGLAVHQVSYGDPPDPVPAAMADARASGATVSFTGSPDRALMEVEAQRLVDEHNRGGGRAQLVPRGAATPTGVLGFVAAAAELNHQLDQLGLAPAAVVIPLGSGVSAAGLAAAGCRWLTIGLSVSRPLADLRAPMAELMASVGATPGELELHDIRGAGFGSVRPEEAGLADEVRRATGLVVDTTYNAKAMTWLAAAPPIDGPVVYWHTGGALGALP